MEGHQRPIYCLDGCFTCCWTIRFSTMGLWMDATFITLMTSFQLSIPCWWIDCVCAYWQVELCILSWGSIYLWCFLVLICPPSDENNFFSFSSDCHSIKKMPSLQKALPPELADNVLRVRSLLHLLLFPTWCYGQHWCLKSNCTVVMVINS
jgi:hypothetical protein